MRPFALVVSDYYGARSARSRSLLEDKMGLASVQRIARATAKPLHLHVELTNRYSYVKVLKMPEGKVAAQASTLEKELSQGLETTSGVEGCGVIGKTVGKRLSGSMGNISWSKDIHVVRPAGKRFHGKFAEVVRSFRVAIDSPSGN